MTYETKNITFHVIRVKVSSKCRIPMYNGRIHTILFECPK